MAAPRFERDGCRTEKGEPEPMLVNVVGRSHRERAAPAGVHISSPSPYPRLPSDASGWDLLLPLLTLSSARVALFRRYLSIQAHTISVSADWPTRRF
jgi:hypothetical protein